MRMHPLHTPEMIAAHMQSTGEYFPQERYTGRSTAIALRIIQVAIQNPHTWIEVKDHHETEDANRMLRDRVRRMVDQLQLQHFIFRGTQVCFGVSTWKTCSA